MLTQRQCQHPLALIEELMSGIFRESMIYQLKRSEFNKAVDQELRECSSLRIRARGKMEQVQGWKFHDELC